MKIGIYEGNIPPPIFINNLIIGLADNGNNVYLYGIADKKKTTYSSSICLKKIPHSKLNAILMFLKNIFGLTINTKYPSLRILKDINNRAGSLKKFFHRCNRVIPVFLDGLDILHIQWAKVLVSYPEFVNFLNCPIIVSLRGAHINYSPLTDKDLAQGYKKYFPKVAGFHAVSSRIAIEAGKYDADPSKITVIQPAVKYELMNNVPSKKTNGSKKLLQIISVGRCHWKKGYTYAMDAMAILTKEKIPFHYTIISSGKDNENILYQIHDLELDESVTFINGLPHDAVIERLSTSDLFLLPSVEEGISNAALEAMAIGIPVVTTDCGGMSEIIQNNINGFIVPVRIPELLAESIIKLIKMTPDAITQLINNAKQTIMESHLLDKQVKKMINLYHELITP